MSAERYNPEEDEDDDVGVIYPKTDSQRSRLAEAVSGILLFRQAFYIVVVVVVVVDPTPPTCCQ